jgi:predicted transcriptional regulator
MQIIIELDAETARQLDFVQQQTNQDHMAVIQQGIYLYYQQLQPHRQFFLEAKSHSELISNIPVSVSTN